MKDLLLPNTFKQKDEKPYTAGLDDTAIPHQRKLPKIPLEKHSSTKTWNPESNINGRKLKNFTLHDLVQSKESFLGSSLKIYSCYCGGDAFQLYKRRL